MHQWELRPQLKIEFSPPKRGSPKPRAKLTPPSHPKKLSSPSGHLPRCDPKNHGRRRMCFDVLFNYTLQPMSTLRADLTHHLIISTNKCIFTCFECNKLPWWLSSRSGQILKVLNDQWNFRPHCDPKICETPKCTLKLMSCSYILNTYIHR